MFVEGEYVEGEYVEGEYVEFSPSDDELRIYYPVSIRWGDVRTIDTRLARAAQFRDGEEVWVAAPNAWSREHMSPETLELRTEPYPMCPDRFWLAGTMTPFDPFLTHERPDLPMVPHPLVYGRG